MIHKADLTKTFVMSDEDEKFKNFMFAIDFNEICWSNCKPRSDDNAAVRKTIVHCTGLSLV